MSLTEREKAIAGFAWQSAVFGHTMKQMASLLEKVEETGVFSEKTLARLLSILKGEKN